MNTLLAYASTENRFKVYPFISRLGENVRAYETIVNRQRW